jgi:predicted lipoprotein with Yx(FWY)xxD motif
MALRRALLVGTACAGLVGCGSGDGYGEGDDGGATSTATDVSVKAEAPRRGQLVRLRRSQFGPVLFSGSDRALYLFTRDGRRKSRCYGNCAAAWPPFYARGKPRAADGVEASLLGTVERRDGRRQVTYRDQPLYFYVHDPKRQVLCNDVVEFGGTWFALDATGEPPA